MHPYIGRRGRVPDAMYAARTSFGCRSRFLRVVAHGGYARVGVPSRDLDVAQVDPCAEQRVRES